MSLHDILSDSDTISVLPFLKPCKAINAKDVDFMYVELIQRCKQMFLTQTEATEDHVYQMPSFLQSIASVLLYLDTVSEMVTLSMAVST